MQVGLIIFSGIPRIKFDLNYSVDKDAIADKIESVKYLTSSTAAISQMTTTVFTKENGV